MNDFVEQNHDDARAHVLRVRTPEGVVFSYHIASPVTRLAALVIDWMVLGVAWNIIGMLLRVFAVFGPDVMQAVLILGYFALAQGYDIVCEWRWRGQTLGKRLMRLRVIDERGLRLALPQIVMRNLLRALDALPAAYMVGGIAALASKRGQRLGDFAAGTLVVRETAEAVPDPAALTGGKYNTLRAHAPVVARLRQAVTPAEARVAWQALARRNRLEETARVELFARLAAHFKTLTAIPPEAVEGLTDEQFVRNIADVLFVERAAGK